MGIVYLREGQKVFTRHSRARPRGCPAEHPGAEQPVAGQPACPVPHHPLGQEVSPEHPVRRRRRGERGEARLTAKRSAGTHLHHWQH